MPPSCTRVFWNELLRIAVLAGVMAMLAVMLTGCYVAPYPYRAVAYVAPPVVVVRAHACWRCW